MATRRGVARSNNYSQKAAQIEQDAAYYPSSVYGGLGDNWPLNPHLTFPNALDLQVDALSEEFVPLSTVAQRSRNPKIFVIGIIPPSVKVSRRLLDRSATVNPLVPASSDTVQIPTDPSREGAPDASISITGELLAVKGLDSTTDEFRQAVIAMAQRHGWDPNHLVTIMSFETAREFRADTGRKNWSPSHTATGLIQFTEATARQLGVPPGSPPYPELRERKSSSGSPPRSEYSTWTLMGMTPEEQLPFVEKYFESNFGNRDPSKLRLIDYYLVVFGQPGIGAPDNQVIFRATDANGQSVKAYRDNMALDKVAGDRSVPPMRKGYITVGDLHRNLRGVQNGANGTISVGSVPRMTFVATTETVAADSNNANWHGTGAQSSAQAQSEMGKLADTPLNGQDLLNAFTTQQTAQIISTQLERDAMASIPPLRMLINPKQFTVKSEKIVADGSQSREGPIVEHWGNQQDKISASGKVAGFYAIDAKNASGPGKTRMARNFSQAWQNFQSLLLLYANNGGLRTPDFAAATSRRNLSLMGSVYIYYDSTLYIGSFDSLSVTESDTAPFTAEYSWEFTARATFLLDTPDLQRNYGSSASLTAQPVVSRAFVGY